MRQQRDNLVQEEPNAVDDEEPGATMRKACKRSADGKKKSDKIQNDHTIMGGKKRQSRARCRLLPYQQSLAGQKKKKTSQIFISWKLKRVTAEGKHTEGCLALPEKRA